MRIYLLVLQVLLLVQQCLASVSIIDLLSSSPDFTSLLRLLQRSGLIPILNTARNVTLLAPPNSVFDTLPPDESAAKLAEYLILTSLIYLDEVDEEEVYFSHLQLPAAPGFPIATKVTREKRDDNSIVMINGQTTVIKQNWQADNGVVQVVDSFVNLPMTMCSGLLQTKEVGLFNDLLSMNPEVCEVIEMLGLTFTIVAPLDVSFSQFNDVELSYLKSVSGEVDRLKLLASHFLETSIYRQNDTNQTGLLGETARFIFLINLSD